MISPTAGLWLGALGYLAGLALVGTIGFSLLFSRDPDDVALLVTTLAIPLPLFMFIVSKDEKTRFDSTTTLRFADDLQT